jgi:hypothetical protein
MFTSRYMAQATPPADTTTAPIPAPVPPPAKKVSTPLVLGIGAGGGALLGYLLTLAMQKVDKRFPKNSSVKTMGAAGGLIGGLLGAGTVLLLKD